MHACSKPRGGGSVERHKLNPVISVKEKAVKGRAGREGPTPKKKSGRRTTR